MLLLMQELAVHRLGIIRDPGSAEEADTLMNALPVETVKALHNFTKSHCRRPTKDMAALSALQADGCFRKLVIWLETLKPYPQSLQAKTI